jgi:hypothetical protein
VIVVGANGTHIAGDTHIAAFHDLINRLTDVPLANLQASGGVPDVAVLHHPPPAVPPVVPSATTVDGVRRRVSAMSAARFRSRHLTGLMLFTCVSPVDAASYTPCPLRCSRSCCSACALVSLSWVLCACTAASSLTPALRLGCGTSCAPRCVW